MTLSNYDPKILNFLYELTKLPKFMGNRAISKNLKLENTSISLKTTERWFKFLNQKYYHPKSLTNDKFDYFPTFFYEKLGLVPIYVILEKPKKSIFEEIPYQDYAAWLYDPKINESVLLNGYLVPIEHLSKFKKQWAKVKTNGLVKSYKIYETHKGFQIYSPWHKVIDKQGIFHPENNDKKEISNQVEKFGYYLDNLPEFKMISEVKKNPLIIPVLFEYNWDHYSSIKVWNRIKSNLNNDVWNYINKSKKQTDGAGIKKVQKIMGELSKYEMFHKVRIVYLPIELNYSFFIYTILKYENKRKLLEILKMLSMKSIYLTLYPIDNNRVFVISLTGGKAIPDFLTILEDIEVERFFFLQHEKSLPLLTNKKIYKFNYKNLFDPKNLEWKWGF